MEDERTLKTDETQEGAGRALCRSAALMARLRAPGGCPWDREQTFDSIKPYTLEETYEVFDAIERRAWPELRDELGDLLLQVLFYAQMAEEAGHFTLEGVAEALNAKLVRRHPHIFGEEVATSPEAVLRNWERIKQQEKREKVAEAGSASEAGSVSLLNDVPRSMPAMLEATKLGSRAAKVGFDWANAAGLFEKLAEESTELRNEVGSNHVARMEEEFGDLLFTMMNLGRHLRIDAESALRLSNAKFRRRFAAMETEAGGAEVLGQMPAEALEWLWAHAKSTTGNVTESRVEKVPQGANKMGELDVAEKLA